MRARFALACTAALVTTACSSPDDPSGELHLVLVQAPATATPGADTLTAIVRVVNGDGSSVPGVPVTWGVASGGGSVWASADTSGIDGLAVAQWIPGLAVGQQVLAASIYDQPALRMTIDARALQADMIATSYGMGCGLRGTEVWCWDSRRPTAGTQRTLSSIAAHDLAMTSGYICVLDGAGSTFCRYSLGDLSTGELMSIPNLPALRSINADGQNFCGIAAADSTAWCWGHGHMTGLQVSPDLRLSSISAGSFSACGLTYTGAAWCWDMAPVTSGPPELVPGGHTFRSITGEVDLRCAIESPTQLYCWTPTDPEPLLFVGTFSASQVALGGTGDNLMSTTSGALVFYFNYDRPGSLTLAPLSEFPFPVKQLGEGCLLALDNSVYCVQENFGNRMEPFTWTAVAAPLP